jgi:hypothetical protein
MSTRANEKTSHDTAVYQRVSGASGLTGKWKARKVTIGSPGSLVLAANGPDEVTLTSVEEKGTCAAKFDGKDHPATGPYWPAGWTCSIAKRGTSGLDMTWKKDSCGIGSCGVPRPSMGNYVTGREATAGAHAAGAF